jgi:S1-C subfamily serine protease
MKQLFKLVALLFLYVFLLGSVPVEDNALQEQASPSVMEPAKPIEETWTMESATTYEASFSFPRIETFGVAETLYPKSQTNEWISSRGTFRLRGSAFVVRDGYVLTAAHCVVPTSVEVVIDRVSVYHTFPLNIITRTVMLYDYKTTSIIADVVYVDTENDVAILRADTTSLVQMPYEIFFPVKIPGSRVAVVVHKRDEDGELTSDLEVQYGTITSPSICNIVPREEVPWFSMLDFSVDVAIQPGDSGSPLFMWIDGKPTCVGIIRAGYRINPFTGKTNTAFAVEFYHYRRFFGYPVY